MLACQIIIQREIYNEEIDHGDVDHQGEHEEEELEWMSFEERMIRALERKK
jgi:hypothetical protein